MSALFSIGRTVMTAGVADKFGPVPPPDLHLCLLRHAAGDWGEMDDEDRARNDESVMLGEGMILSQYTVGGTRVWIITDSDRQCTTILLPEEYRYAGRELG